LKYGKGRKLDFKKVDFGDGAVNLQREE